MEGPSRPSESRARPRERDPGRPPRADRERRPERPRDGAGTRRGDRSRDGRGNGRGDRSGDRRGDGRGDRNGDRRGDGRGDRNGDRRGDSRGDRNGDRSVDGRRDRNGDRSVDGRRDGRGDRNGEKRGDRRDWDRAKGRDPLYDGAAPGEPGEGEQRAGGRPRPGRTRDAPPRPPWDAAPPPGAAPWGPPESPPAWKQSYGYRGPESEFAAESYLPPYPGPGREDVDYYQSEARGLLDCHKCRYLCTGRGVVQMVAVILNGMVLICVVASYFALAGVSASFTSGGSFGSNYFPFEGTELEQVRQLDQQYTVLRSPLIYGGVAVSLGLGVLTMGVLLQGAKSLSRLPPRWLLLEVAFSVLAAAGYCVGIGFYLHGALRINATDTCKARERLYARRGLTWMNCQLAGTDGAAATFACLLVLMYSASVVLVLRSMREQKRLCKDSRSVPPSYGHAPEYLWSGTL